MNFCRARPFLGLVLGLRIPQLCRYTRVRVVVVVVVVVAWGYTVQCLGRIYTGSWDVCIEIAGGFCVSKVRYSCIDEPLAYLAPVLQA